MKKFTVIGMVLIVAIFVGLLGYVAAAPEFEPPLSATIANSDTDSWNMTMDELLNYMADKGLIDLSQKGVLSAGVASEAYTINGAEFYWWDLENLDKDSIEYKSYEGMVKDGLIDLWGKGSFYMATIPNGPFGLNLTHYLGNTDDLEQAFRDFGKKEEIDLTTGIWTMSLDELAAYMEDQGAVDADSRININFSAGTTGCSGYRYTGNIDIYYYDLANMDEDNPKYEEYYSIRKTGSMVYVNGAVGYYTVNGPFMLHFYQWAKDPVPEEDRQAIIDTFLAFAQE